MASFGSWSRFIVLVRRARATGLCRSLVPWFTVAGDRRGPDPWAAWTDRVVTQRQASTGPTEQWLYDRTIPDVITPTQEAAELQRAFTDLVRGFGLHRPGRTPCGQPLTVSEANALLELAGDTAITQTELAVRLQLQKSTVSRLVAQMEDKAWVVRERDGHDQRAWRLRMSAAGTELSEALETSRRIKFEQLLENIPDEKRHAVLEAVRLLADASRQETLP